MSKILFIDVPYNCLRLINLFTCAQLEDLYNVKWDDLHQYGFAT